MAISKERKNELTTQYRNWASRSQGLFIAEYRGLTMKDIDAIRSRVREIGGEFHIMKNTLGKLALEAEGFSLPEDCLQGSTAVVFAFKDAPAIAKTMMEFTRTSEFLKFKGGFLDRQSIGAKGVQSLAELPPLPVVQAKLLGTILTPASRLVGVLAAPARQVASVIKAYADKENTPAAA